MPWTIAPAGITPWSLVSVFRPCGLRPHPRRRDRGQQLPRGRGSLPENLAFRQARQRLSSWASSRAPPETAAELVSYVCGTLRRHRPHARVHVRAQPGRHHPVRALRRHRGRTPAEEIGTKTLRPTSSGSCDVDPSGARALLCKRSSSGSTRGGFRMVGPSGGTRRGPVVRDVHESRVRGGAGGCSTSGARMRGGSEDGERRRGVERVWGGSRLGSEWYARAKYARARAEAAAASARRLEEEPEAAWLRVEFDTAVLSRPCCDRQLHLHLPSFTSDVWPRVGIVSRGDGGRCGISTSAKKKRGSSCSSHRRYRARRRCRRLLARPRARTSRPTCGRRHRRVRRADTMRRDRARTRTRPRVGVAPARRPRCARAYPRGRDQSPGNRPRDPRASPRRAPIRPRVRAPPPRQPPSPRRETAADLRHHLLSHALPASPARRPILVVSLGAWAAIAAQSYVARHGGHLDVSTAFAVVRQRRGSSSPSAPRRAPSRRQSPRTPPS